MTLDKTQNDTAADVSSASISAEERLISLVSSLSPIQFVASDESRSPKTGEKARSADRLSQSQFSRISQFGVRAQEASHSDQAYSLRGLIEQHFHPETENDELNRHRAYTIAVTSGKGGVGKSLISLNLALAVARQGARVCLIDANLGLGNLDLLCGLNGYWNLSHVVIGSRDLADIILTGPEGIDLIPGASGLAELADCPAAAQQSLLRQMKQLEDNYDFLILDTGTGIHTAVRRFVAAADLVLVVTTPEPTSIADAYATIKAIQDDEYSRLEVLVNQCDDDYARRICDRIAETSKMFLHKTIASAGAIPCDAAVVETVRRRRPLMVDSPQSPAAQALTRLARRMFTLKRGQTRRPHFFERMWNRLLNRPA